MSAMTPSGIPDATPTSRGLMSDGDKAKLDGIPPGGGGGPISSVTEANGLTLDAGVLALDEATPASSGAMPGSDKTKLDAITGTNTGDVTLAAFGSTPSAAGASLSGQALTLQPADGSNPGGVSTVAQTFGGAKTLSGAILNGITTIAEAVTSLVRAAAATLVLRSSLGAGSSDVATKLGTSETDAGTHATAKLLSVRTGLGGTEVEKFYITKTLAYFGGGGLWSLDNTVAGGLGVKTGATPVLAFLTSGVTRSAYGFDVNPTFGAFLSLQLHADGRVNQRGTDSSASPGAATADRPIGKNAIAAAASSVTITNSLVTTASVILITPHARDATCKELIAVPAAGSFTVSGSAAATAAVPFSWEVKGLL